MQFLHNDRTLFSEGFLHIGGVVINDTVPPDKPSEPDIEYRDRTLCDLCLTTLGDIANMTLSELSIIRADIEPPNGCNDNTIKIGALYGLK